MQSRTFRLSDNDIKLLSSIAEREGCTQTDVIRRALREYGNQEDEDITSNDSNDALVSTLQAEVKYLREALTQAQAVNAIQAQAQQLALESAEQKRRRWRWPWQRD